MRRNSMPFNITLLQLQPQDLSRLRPIRVLDILEASKQTFHPEGLWSNEIFGSVGEDRRNTSFAYIDIKLPVIHPVVFKQLVSAKSLYRDIMAGEAYATWSEAEQDFVRSNPIDGETGYHFFIRHFPLMKIKDTNTVKRSQLIRLLNKFREKCLNSYIIVLPAGLRDVEFENGRMTVDDTNAFYRKLISLSNNITDSAIRNSPELMDKTRYAIQMTFVSLYEHLSNMVEGKKKLFLGKWASRRIFNGTRNVITAISAGGRYLGNADDIRFNNTVIGLFQMLKGILPVARYHIKNGFLSQVFQDPSIPVRLINPATMETEETYIDPSYFDRYQSDEGIEKLINEFAPESSRHNPMMIDGKYLGLMYKGPDGTFKIFSDLNELPEDRSRDNVEPLTFGQLLYCSTYPYLNNVHPMTVVRYPIAGIGSTPLTLPYTKTTVKSEVRYELDDNWQKTDKKAVCFPVTGDTWHNSLSPATSLIGPLKADYDGDTMSANLVYTDEAMEEAHAFLNSFRAYINTSGRFIRSMSFDTVDFCMHNLSDVPPRPDTTKG